MNDTLNPGPYTISVELSLQSVSMGGINIDVLGSKPLV